MLQVSIHHPHRIAVCFLEALAFRRRLRSVRINRNGNIPVDHRGCRVYILCPLLGSISTHLSSENATKLGIRPELMPNLRGLASAIGGTHSLVSNVATLLLSSGVFLWAVRKRWSFSLAVIVALLVSYHQTISDASLLILPIGLAAVSAVKDASGKSALVAALCALIIVAPGPLMLVGVGFYLLAIPILILFFLWDEDIATIAPSSTLLAGSPARL